MQLPNLAKARVRIGGILNREQIVGYRDYGEQNQNQYAQGNNLGSPVLSRAVSKPQPQTHEEESHECPKEVEGQFHTHSVSLRMPIISIGATVPSFLEPPVQDGESTTGNAIPQAAALLSNHPFADAGRGSEVRGASRTERASANG